MTRVHSGLPRPQPDPVGNPGQAQRVRLVGVDSAFSVADHLRQARRLADLSQRDLARAAGVSPGAVARLESDSPSRPSVQLFARLLAAAGLRLAVVDRAGNPVAPMASSSMRDQAGRHFPAHLDVRRWRRSGDWWYDFYRTTMEPGPTHTFDRSRRRRDDLRARTGRNPGHPDGRHELCEPRPPDWRAADVSRRDPWRPAPRSGRY